MVHSVSTIMILVTPAIANASHGTLGSRVSDLPLSAAKIYPTW